MSRHRHIRTMNVQDELEDHALSDGGEEDMTPEHQEQMEYGLEQIRGVIGDEQVSGLSDATLRDVLWEYYFDIGRAIQWAIDEQARRRAAQERKGDVPDDKTLPSLPEDDVERPGYSQYPHPWLQRPVIFAADRPRVPLIHLAQQQQERLMEEQHTREEQEEEEQAQQELLQSLAMKRPLSTISEERTSKMSNNRSSTVTSYGKVIETSSQAETIRGMDRVPPPSSASAMYRLSQSKPRPSGSETSSILAPQVPNKSSETVPSLDVMPEIPDLNSKSSLIPHSQSQTAPEAKPKKSKLSLLASSRAGSVRSVATQSESSSGSTLHGSVKTYPDLRPTARSLAPPSTIAPSFPEDDASMPISSSSASSLVRRAIQVALNQEARDKDSNQRQAATKSALSVPSQSHQASTLPSSQANKAPPLLSSQPKSPRPPLHLQTSKVPSSSQPTSAPPPPSAHPQPSMQSPPPVPISKPVVPKLTKTVATPVPADRGPQQLSKLAKLAQTKIDPRKIPKLPKTTTEYLTPIANGSSVTTAITTHYQSLFSLTDPNHSGVLPQLDLVPLSELPVDLPSPQKRATKLAMKIRRSHEQRNNELLQTESKEIPIVVSPVFDSLATHSRALPSQFASLLISDDQKGGGKKEGSKLREPKGDTSAAIATRRSRKQTALPPVVQPTSAFDGPSPDDIVFNARRGTHLGQPRSQVSASSRVPTLPAKS